MSAQRDLDERTVDALAALAAESEPPALSSARRDAQIAAAIREAERAPARREPSRWGSARHALAAAAVVLLGIFAAREWALERATVRGAGELVLPTGDRLLTSPSATLRFEDLTAESRLIDLYRGEALFDVQPLGPGQSFRVRAAELEVEVRGTVFAVELTEDDAIVRVYEGHVDVRAHGEVVASLQAGEAFSARRGRHSGVDEGAFAAEGRRAAEARGATSAGQRSSATTLAVPDALAEREASATVEPDTVEPSTLEPSTLERTVEPSTLEQGTVERRTLEPSTVGARTDPRSDEERTATRSPTDEPPIAIADVVALLGARRFDEALDAARRGAAGTGQWRFSVLEAQALEGLGRPAEAADALDALARVTTGDARAEAAYRAASVRSRALGDPRGAVRSLDAASFDGTAFDERALGLRARALEAAGDRAAATRAAEQYLARYPEGGLAADMRALVDPR